MIKHLQSKSLEHAVPNKLSWSIPLLVISITLFSISTNAQIGEGKCKFIGNVISGSVPADFGTYWNQVTPENAGKWGSVESVRDNMQWAGLDIAYNYAQNNNLPFKHHTFIWGNQQPQWIESLTQEEQLEEIEEWISEYCSRYSNTEFIDVVNEPINDPPNQAGDGGGNYMNALGGTGTTGYDWIIKSFELARQYCPNAKLLINEYNLLNNNSRTTQYLNIVNLLKESDLIDGIGIQGHRFELENTSDTQLKSNLDKLGTSGLPIYISEFDIGNINNEGTPDDAKQLEIYKRVFPILWTHPSVEGITFWGYLQGQIWQQTAYLKLSNGTERPALEWLKSYVPTVGGGVFCLPITGSEEEQSGFKISPNPAIHGKFTVDVSDAASRVTITDMSGRIIKKFSMDGKLSAKVELQVSPGIYIIQIENTRKTITKKLAIQ